MCQHRAVTVKTTENPIRRLVIHAAVGIAAAGIVVVVLWLVSSLAVLTFARPSSATSVAATVVSTASCEGQDDHDTVTFQFQGATHRAKSDTCGQQTGARLTVLVPPRLTDSTVVEPAATAPGDASGLLHRVAFLLLIVSAAVGGAYLHYLLRHPAHSAGRPAAPPAKAGTGGQPGRSDRSEPSESSDTPAEDRVDWFADSGSTA